MAITVTNLGTGSNKASTQISFTAANAAAAGTVIVVGVCDGGTSSTNLPSDTQGNTYASIATTFNNSTGTASGFTTLYYAIVTTALTTSDSIRYTPTSGNGAAVTAFFLTGVSNVTPYQVASANTGRGSSTLPQATTSVAQVMPGTCVVGIVGVNDPSTDSFTQDSTHATFTTPPVRVGTTGNPASSNWVIAGGSVVRTGTSEGALIYGPTITSAKWGVVIAAFQPQLLTGVSGTGGVGTLTAQYSGSPSVYGVQGFTFPTNYARNPLGTGLVAGTVGSTGTMPTNWEAHTNSNGLAWEVSTGATYTVSGYQVPTVRLRLHGTTSNSSAAGFEYEYNRGITGLLFNQTVTQSAYVALVAGSYTNVTTNHWGPINDGTSDVVDSQQPCTFTSSFVQYSMLADVTPSSGNAPFKKSHAGFVFYPSGTGVAVDITIDVGAGQLVYGSSTQPLFLDVAIANPRGVISGVQAEAAVQSWASNLLDYSFTGGSAPSTLPTNMFGFGTLSGLTATYAYGTENGIAYFEVHLSGTSTASPFAEVAWAFAPANPLPAGTAGPVSVGQTWVHEFYVKQVGGTATNVSDVRVHIDEKDASGTYLIGSGTVYPAPFWTNALGTVTASYSRTLTSSTVAGLTPYISIVYFGGPIDITLRIGQPMLSQATLAGGTITRASNATYIDSNGKMQLASSNVLRTDYSSAPNLSVTSIGSNTGKTVSSIVITLPAAVPAGCTIFVAAASAGSSILTNVADSVGQSNWVGGNGAATTNGTIILDWCWNATAMPASSTITVTRSGGGTFTGAVYAWYVTGLVYTASPLDAAQTGSGTSTTSVSLTTGTLAQVAEYVVGALAVDGAGTETFTNDANFGVLPSYRTGTTGGSDITVDVGMRLVTGTSGVNYAPTLGTARDYAAYLATFRLIGWGQVLTEGASTNLVPNANTGDPTWNSSLSSPPAVTPIYSAASLWKLTSPGGSFNYAAFVTIPVTPNQIYTCSAWVYLPVGYTDVPIEIDFDYAPPGATTLIVVGTNNSLLGQWQRIYRTVITAPGTDPAMNVVLRPTGSSTAGAIAYFQCFQVEPGYLSSYIPTTGSAANRAADTGSPTGLEVVGKLLTGVYSTGSVGTLRRQITALGVSGTGYVGLDYYNRIRNTAMSGAVAGAIGSGGAPPTHWQIDATFGYLTKTIVGTGTVGTQTYIDISVSGTVTDPGPLLCLNLTEDVGFYDTPSVPIAASAGQSWTASAYLALTSGSFPDNVAIGFNCLDNSGVNTAFLLGNIGPPTGTLTQYSYTATLTGSTTTNLIPALWCYANNGQVVSFTLRIASPVVTPSSGYIPSSSVAITGVAGTSAVGIAVGVPQTDRTSSVYGVQGFSAPQNWVRNPTGTGLVAGTVGAGGAMPTNWDIGGGTNGLNYDVSVGATYNVGGVSIPTVRVRVYGTTASIDASNIVYEAAGGIKGLMFGVTKTQSIYVALVAGSLTNVSNINHWGQILDNSDVIIADQQSPFTPTSTFTQYSQSNTMPSSGNGPYRWYYASVLAYFGASPGVAIDFTLDLGGGQLAALTSPIIPSIGADTGGITGVAGTGSATALGGGTFSRASSATYIDATGQKMALVGNDVMRTDYSTGTGQVLLEPASTNLIPNTLTTKPGAQPRYTSVVSTDITPLYSAATVWKVTDVSGTGDNNAGAYTVSVPAIGVTYTGSIWVWIPSAYTSSSAPVGSLDGGTLIANNDANLSLRNQWQRITRTGISTATSVPLVLRFVSNVGDYIYHTAWQIELGATTTSYIPTSGSTATRVADSAATAGIPIVSKAISGISGVAAAGSAGIAVACLDPLLNLYHNSSNPNRLLADPLAGTSIAVSFTAPHDLILLEVDLLITK